MVQGKKKSRIDFLNDVHKGMHEIKNCSPMNAKAKASEFATSTYNYLVMVEAALRDMEARQCQSL